MAIKKLDKTQWQAYFDAFSRPFAQGKQVEYAEVRVFSQELGAQPHTQWLPLFGITYDGKGDLLEVVVENLDYIIYHPEEIYVDEEADGLVTSMEVLQPDGTKEVIEFR